MEKKITNRQKQAIRTRNTIYDTALKLMDKHGLDNITVEEICKKAGVSVGSFYHYFKSKNDIFFEIYKRGDDYFENVVAKELKEKEASEMIVDYFVNYAKYNLLSGLDVIKQLYNTNNKQFIAKGRFMQNLLKDIISKGQERGEITDKYSEEYISDFIFISVRGLVYDWCLHEGGYELDVRMKEFIEDIVGIFKN